MLLGQDLASFCPDAEGGLSDMFSIQHRLSWLLTFALVMLIAGTTSATVFSFGVSSGGLDDGHACLSSAGTGACAVEALFEVDGLYAITGGFDYDDVAGTIDLAVTLSSGKMVGSHDGVFEIEFIETEYKAIWTTVFFLGGSQLLGADAPVGSVAGVDAEYEQFDSVPTSVVGPDPVSETAFFSSLSCLFVGGLSGVAECGFTGGGPRDVDPFDLPVGTTGGGDSFDFRHTFNFTVPEPSTALLLASGLLILAGRRGWR